MVGITFMVDFYYIYGGYYVYGCYYIYVWIVITFIGDTRASF